MKSRIVTFAPGMSNLGRAVVAIGVFDGVHLGHCQLLEAAAAEAAERGDLAIAVTFDRDPDQIVTPDSAAPQLLTLDGKLDAISRCGIDIVLVVPFTSDLAALGPRAFLDEVLATAVRVSAIHVGQDFRFGTRASGTVDTLAIWATEHMAAVRPHSLLCIDGQPVTSTRIRALVASGDVEEAARLLNRPTRVSGTVVRGRGEGATLGFPTANIKPIRYAAIPADGVYAGRVVLEDGRAFASAVSVGIPPTFPDAKDYIEAHLIGFNGDLYEETVTVEFVKRLRSQRAFTSLDELTAAINADVAETTRLVGADPASGDRHTEEAQPSNVTAPNPDSWDSIPDGWTPRTEDPAEADSEWVSSPFESLVHGISALFVGDEDDESYDEDIIEDPEALEAAERAVAGIDRDSVYRRYDASWVEALGPIQVGNLLVEGATGAWTITAPLEAAEIPFVWDPFPPDQQSSARPDLNWRRTFRLLVPKDRVDEARGLLGKTDPPAAKQG